MTADALPEFTAAILAGGQARRLGGADKCTLVIGGRTILDRQLELLRAITRHLLIVAGEGRHVPAPGVSIVRDRRPGAGALGGLYTALLEAPTEQVLVIACDMPFLTAPLLLRLVEAGRGVDAAVPRDGRGRHPLCASYARRVAPHLQACIDSRRLAVREALRGLAVREVGPDELAGFDPEGRLLLNVNTPDDYAHARAGALRDAPHS